MRVGVPASRSATSNRTACLLQRVLRTQDVLARRPSRSLVGPALTSVQPAQALGTAPAESAECVLLASRRNECAVPQAHTKSIAFVVTDRMSCSSAVGGGGAAANGSAGHTLAASQRTCYGRRHARYARARRDGAWPLVVPATSPVAAVKPMYKFRGNAKLSMRKQGFHCALPDKSSSS